MDWLEDKLSARFIFKNPNISKCLCGRRHQTSWILTSAQLSNAVAVNHSASREAFLRANLNVYIDRTAAFVAFSLHFSTYKPSEARRAACDGSA
jgi:hypothetical protein